MPVFVDSCINRVTGASPPFFRATKLDQRRFRLPLPELTSTAKMLDFSQFAAAFPTDGPKPYDQNGVREIETFRKSFEGVLFIDRVMKALGVSEGKAYPPRGDSGLRALHKQICDTKVSPHAKLSVFYYLLLDYDELRGARSDLAEALAEESGLPPNYQLLMRGLWHMDRKEFKFALEHLAHPSLPSEFADDIITVLVRHAKADDYSLPLAYYHTTQPVLQTSEALELLFGALARTSVAEALYFSRARPEPARQQLFERLVASVLEHPEAAGARGKELVSLPLTGAEEKWFQEYVAGGGEGRKSKNAKAVAQMRQVVTGRHRGPMPVGGLGGQGTGVRAGR
ncbi:nuclear pore complex assembly-domain-containing protein [Chaetomium fimeti]|uniref:Nuclear pore complex assembly-domain-containing protein n=1 Tax=Chaetomium fimeti TaxID=1854472 RepID=A0AAE0H6A3_9PEZI|nr:nuclear pore complex assembly-domain-containing protein [Chaetomium fimeti]